MGVNNLSSFLGSNSLQVVPVKTVDNYDLYVDLAIIVVPLMQRARDVKHFIRLLRETFGGSGSVGDSNNDNNTYIGRRPNELVNLIIRAKTVSMYLDMLSPRMKIETHRFRNSRSMSEKQTAQLPVKIFNDETAVFLSNHWRQRDNNTTVTSNSPLLFYRRPLNVYNSVSLSNVFADNGSSITNDATTADNYVEGLPIMRYNFVKLRDVRESIPEIIQNSLNEWDKNVSARCVIETNLIGEGEIKCVRSAIIRKQSDSSNDRSIVVLSNDNDVILMMLMHQPSLLGVLFYRVTINDTNNDHLSSLFIQKIILGRDSVIRRVAVHDRWRVLLWLICCCGTDFVSPIRPMSTSRRVEIFNTCLEQYVSMTTMTSSTCNSSVTPLTFFTFDTFIVELRRFLRFIELNYTVNQRVNYKCVKFDDVVVETSNLSTTSTRQRRLTTVAAWIIRLYWNLLYLIDLPVDFFNEPCFPTDLNVLVNCYVPNEYISIFAILFSLREHEDNDLRRTIDRLLKQSIHTKPKSNPVQGQRKNRQKDPVLIVNA